MAIKFNRVLLCSPVSRKCSSDANSGKMKSLILLIVLLCIFDTNFAQVSEPSLSSKKRLSHSERKAKVRYVFSIFWSKNLKIVVIELPI